MNRFCVLLQLFALLFLLELSSVQGHGRLMDPVARGSRWRFNASAPADYNDNEGFCGGFGVQYGQNNGKCGLCGNDYAKPTPRAHEFGGVYGEGVVVKGYSVGAEMEVTVLLTANHRGYFSFDVCNMANEAESEECFAKNPIELTTGGYKYQLKNFSPASFQTTLRLPANLACEHCVFRWTYTTGNNWGTCPDGSGANGCGPQETFKGCSDISIL